MQRPALAVVIGVLCVAGSQLFPAPPIWALPGPAAKRSLRHILLGEGKLEELSQEHGIRFDPSSLQCMDGRCLVRAKSKVFLLTASGLKNRDFEVRPL